MRLLPPLPLPVPLQTTLRFQLLSALPMFPAMLLLHSHLGSAWPLLRCLEWGGTRLLVGWGAEVVSRRQFVRTVAERLKQKDH